MRLSKILRDRQKLRVRLLAAEIIARPGEGLLARRWLSPDLRNPAAGRAKARRSDNPAGRGESTS